MKLRLLPALGAVVGLLPFSVLFAEDLAEEEDTLIKHAAKLLRKFPQDKVPYDPDDFGWGMD